MRRSARASSSGISCRRGFRLMTPKHGFVTGFYEPEVEASPVRTEQIHRSAAVAAGRSGRRRRRQPPGGHGPLSRLCAADAGRAGRIFRPGGDRAGRAGRARAGDRLAGRARSMPSSSTCRARRGSNMTDGSMKRVTYAAKSGQRFSGPGRILADLGEIPLERGDDAVDPRLVRRAIRERVDEILLAEPLLHLLPRGAGRRSRRSGRSRRRRCR